MYIIRILGDETTIDLGRRGENRALAIDFPIDNFIANYGDGMASLVHLRPGDTEPYICGTETVVSDGATYLRWVVTDTDTAKAGSGRCELRWNVDDTGDGDTEDAYDTRAKSIIYTTTVHPSLTDETEIPDPYKDWYDTMMAALAPAIDAADSPVLKLLNGGVKTTSSSTNLNSFKYVTEGVYYHDGSVTLTNAPVSGQFVMIVREQPMQQNPSDTEYTLSWFTRVLVTLGSAPQVWIQCGQLYRPFTHPPTFFTWRKIPSASDITSIESDLDTLTTAVTDNTAGLSHKLDLYTGTKIESNTDLNTLTTPGTYFCVNSATAATLVNSPLSTVGFRLDVSRNGYNTDNYLVQTIQAVSTSIVVIYKRGMPIKGTWGAWERINAGETEYTSLACSYGTLTYKCYKTGRIVSLIATIDVTSDVPARADLVTGLPYTNTTGTLNYTPIIAFDNTSGEHPIFEVHRANNNTDCSLLCRTAIASGASIRINATYATA